MTFKERAIGDLLEAGLTGNEAETIVSQIKNESLIALWDEQSHGYPNSLYTLFDRILRFEALTWIDKNEPQHFARQMFV